MGTYIEILWNILWFFAKEDGRSLEVIFDHDIMLDSFSYMENIDYKNNDGLNVNVSNETNGNEDQSSYKLGKASSKCHEFIDCTFMKID
jgi:hypothetical protein